MSENKWQIETGIASCGIFNENLLQINCWLCL